MDTPVGRVNDSGLSRPRSVVAEGIGAGSLPYWSSTAPTFCVNLVESFRGMGGNY